MNPSSLSSPHLLADHPWVRRIDKAFRAVLLTCVIGAAVIILTPPNALPPVALHNIHLAGYTNNYNVAETYGGTNPVETCTKCEVWGKQDTGTASPPSTEPDAMVNTGTGDMSNSYTLFSVPDPGFNLQFKLSYDALYAQLQTFYAQLLGQGAYGGQYGFGWRTDGSTSAVVNTQGQYAQVELPTGSEAEFQQFNQGVNNPCQAGDSVKSSPNSQYQYCGASRIDALFGSFNNYNAFNLYLSGGRQIIGYNYFGQVVSEGTLHDPYEINYQYSVPVNQGGCTGPVQTANCTIVSDITGHSYVVSMQNITVNNLQLPVALQVKDPASNVWTFGNVASSDLGAVTDPNGHSWQFRYDQTAGAPDYHDLTQLIDPNNNATRIAYTPAGTNGGLVSSVTDAGGNPTTYSGWNVALQNSGTAYQTVVTHPNHQVVTDVYQLYSISTETSSSNLPNDTAVAGTHYQYGGTPDNPIEWVTDSMGNTTTATTDGVGNVVTEANNTYGTTTTEYNQFDEPCWSAPPGVQLPSGPSCPNGPSAGSGATLYSYNTYGDLIQTTDPSGVSTYEGRDAHGELCWKTTPGTTVTGSPPCTSAPAASTYYAYAGALLMSTSTPDGVGSSVTYDTTTYTYDNYGQMLTQVTPNGNVAGGNPAAYRTTNHYDSAGRLYQVDTPMSRSSSVTLDAAGNVLTETDPVGNVTTKTYDADNRLCWSHVGVVTNPSCTTTPSQSTSYSYNADTSDPTAMIDPNGNWSTYTYFNATVSDKATTVTDGMGNVTSNVYDANGNLCVTGAGSTSLYGSGYNASCGWTSGYTYDTFDELGNVITTENPSQNMTIYSRSNAAYPSDVTTMTPPIGGTLAPIGYTYDLNGRLHTKAVQNGGSVETITYYPSGQKCWQAPINAPTDTCSTDVSHVVGASLWGYYNSQLPWVMKDVTGGTTYNLTWWTYDAQGQETSLVNNAGTVGYAYDAAADNTCVAYPSSVGSSCSNLTGTIVQYGYDSNGRMSSMKDWLNNSGFTFGYDPKSNVNSITYPTTTGWSETYNYDPANNLTSRTLQNPGYNYHGTEPFTPNADNHYATQNNVADGYNAKSQVTSVGSLALGYNPDGEINKDMTQNLVGLDYNAESQLVDTNTPATHLSFGYDVNGNRCYGGIYTWNNCSSVDTSNYGWNNNNQLCFVATQATGTCVNPPTGSTVRAYTYDGNNLRVSATLGAGTPKLFAYNTQTRPGQPLVIEDGTNAYLFGPGNFGAGTAPLEQISLSTSTPGYLFNLQSGVEAYTNSVGQTAAAYTYAPYGAATTSGTSGLTPFGFQGGYTDPTGLIYFINRYYDPATDQFLSVDPLVAATGQPYAFSGSDPLNATDPMGLCNGPDGMCRNPSTGVLNPNSSVEVSDRPGTTTASPMGALIQMPAATSTEPVPKAPAMDGPPIPVCPKLAPGMDGPPAPCKQVMPTAPALVRSAPSVGCPLFAYALDYVNCQLFMLHQLHQIYGDFVPPGIYQQLQVPGVDPTVVLKGVIWQTGYYAGQAYTWASTLFAEAGL